MLKLGEKGDSLFLSSVELEVFLSSVELEDDDDATLEQLNVSSDFDTTFSISMTTLFEVEVSEDSDVTLLDVTVSLLLLLLLFVVDDVAVAATLLEVSVLDSWRLSTVVGTLGPAPWLCRPLSTPLVIFRPGPGQGRDLVRLSIYKCKLHLRSPGIARPR